MRVDRLLAVMFAISGVPGGSIAAQSSWCTYRHGTLRAIMDEHRSSLTDNLPPGHRSDIVSADTRPTRATLVYLGETRLLTGLDSAFMDGYFHRFTRDSSFRALFHRQVSFAEGSDTLWLPVQDSLISALEAEVRTGGSVTVFARWLGAVQYGARTTWLFTINEFATPTSQAAWERVFAECLPM